ncbi:hypothetical protein [Bradyrhizobium yuanmingense]|uniref:Cap15 family cyclic dinucleotide receptor domain-containing protein n=1 Tax=Bradyrhizobium yuanmingense TaxID=108015 RepID=UPI0035198B3E
MIALLPIRAILVLVVILCIGVFSVLAFTSSFNGETLHDIGMFTRFAIPIPVALLVGLYILWRVTASFRKAALPYLGGKWTGHLRFGPPDQQELREAELTITHTLTRMTLVLETRESLSETLVVVPTRDVTGTQHRIYYVFENRRKPKYTKPGLPQVYRGVAIMRLAEEGQLELSGEYFTDQSGHGVAEFVLEKRALF